MRVATRSTLARATSREAGTVLPCFGTAQERKGRRGINARDRLLGRTYRNNNTELWLFYGSNLSLCLSNLPYITMFLTCVISYNHPMSEPGTCCKGSKLDNTGS